mmetsp:Transcript_6274/g.18932  ORF Transcript_6274/g.18932 Transcript_6274/m.18932 type:complete len:182 (+) Transcript_6274:289-834(+)
MSKDSASVDSDKLLPDRKRDGIVAPSLPRNVTFSALEEYANSRDERKLMYDGEYYDDEYDQNEQLSPHSAVRTERGSLSNHETRREQRLKEADALNREDGDIDSPCNDNSSNKYANYVKQGKGFGASESRLKQKLRKSMSLRMGKGGLRQSRLLSSNPLTSLGTKIREIGSKLPVVGNNQS